MNGCRLGRIGVAILLYSTKSVLEASEPLWSANHESGNEVQWYRHSGGGEFDSGCAGVQPSIEVARSGRLSLQLTMGAPCAPPSSAARMFRWHEPRLYPDLYYRVWYYLPRSYTVTGSGIPGDGAFWNILQWKSRSLTPPRNDPFFMLNIANRPESGAMFLYLFDSKAQVSHPQAIVDVPVGRWFSVEAVYRSREDATGQVAIWQDGILLWDVTGVQTRYPDSEGGTAEWSVNNFSNGVAPAPTILFIDDAEIRHLADAAAIGIPQRRHDR